jgi:hypothetical protein
LAPPTDQDKLAERHAIAGDLPGVYLRPRVSERHASRNDRLEQFQENHALHLMQGGIRDNAKMMGEEMGAAT